MVPTVLRKYPLFLCIAAIATVSGCSDPAAKYVGSYTGKMQVGSTFKSKFGQQGVDQANKLMNAASCTLDLRKDKTYDVNLSAFGQTKTESGTWKFVENKILLTPTSKEAIGDGKTTQLGVTEVGSLSSRDSRFSITFTKSSS